MLRLAAQTNSCPPCTASIEQVDPSQLTLERVHTKPTTDLNSCNRQNLVQTLFHLQRSIHLKLAASCSDRMLFSLFCCARRVFDFNMVLFTNSMAPVEVVNLSVTGRNTKLYEYPRLYRGAKLFLA